MKMYYGCGGSGTDKEIGGGFVENILISGATLWNGRKFKNFYPPAHKCLFLDSGGFSFFHKSGDYPFSIRQYVGLAHRLRADVVAVLDYPCEPDVTRTSGKDSNIERIEATIRNAKVCFKFKDIPWLMVVQGYYESEYQYCCDRIMQEGLVTPIIGIGSLCMRKKINEARKVIRVIKRNFPNSKIHGFGIDLRFIRDFKIRSLLFSADTQAWRWNYGNQSDGMFPRSRSDELESFERYNAEVKRLVDSDSDQSSLREYTL